MSLCFREAFLAKQYNEITEDEYMGHLLAHFRGVRHPHDSGKDTTVSKSDPFGAAIRDMALKTDYQPLEDTTPYEKLFSSCLKGSLDQVKFNLKELEQDKLPLPLQPLAVLATSSGHLGILQLCLDEGAKPYATLERSAQLVATKYPAILSHLSKHKKRTQIKLKKNQRFSPEQLDEWFGDVPW